MASMTFCPWVRGKLPEDREKMLKKLEKALGEHGDAPWPVALVD